MSFVNTHASSTRTTKPPEMMSVAEQTERSRQPRLATNDAELPRLLVLSQTIPQSVYAGSILLHRLLKEYPADKLLVIGPAPNPKSELLDCRYEIIVNPTERFYVTRFSKLARSFQAFGLTPLPTVNSIGRLLKDFQPQIVLTVMQDQPFYHLAYRFAELRQLPLVLLIHDLPGWFETVYPWAESSQAKRDAKVYSFATKRISVSPEMRDQLAATYNIAGEFLYPNRSEELTPRPLVEAKTLKEADTLTLAYAGSLGFGRAEMLHCLIPACQKAKAKIRFYSKDSLPTDSTGVLTHCGYTPPGETWLRVKNECDAVLLPYYWPDSGAGSIHTTSFPSKLPEYLALGMPVFIVGPPTALGVKWALQHPGAALVNTEDNSTAWAHDLIQLRESAALRESLSQGALAAGARDFDPLKIRRQFLRHIQESSCGLSNE